MFSKVHQSSSHISAESSQQAQPKPLWNKLTEAEQEVSKGGFGFPGFPPVGPWRPGEINKTIPGMGK
ncbi:hypothetical protein [Leptothoe sp. PORK10 BA2]|uniref:hypothetical protein n=1 Tax=Leptothoe sp. PORK10 BA2 TaxID=3110254 RepID=UPI002B219C6F|nr:hypothetical protein [Leptothoe sp. PORK10 BA2]MEA5466239.1 hypothetical protein [Leptothoe sp. PORK10 BA2]